MKTILALLVFALALNLSAKETVHESLALSDGRTFAQAKIISDTPLTVVIQVGTRIHQVDKKLLPADVLALWPIDEARFARDTAEVKRKAEQQAEGIRKAKLVAEAGRKEQIAKAIAYEEANKPRVLTPEGKAAWLAKVKAEYGGPSNGGLVLRGAGSSYGEIYVMIRNISGVDIRFEARQLRFLTADTKEDSFTGTYVRADGVDEPVIKAGRSRIFCLGRNGTGRIESVFWSGGAEKCEVHVLQGPRSQVAMGDQVAAQRRERAKATAAGAAPESEVIAALRAYAAPSARLRAK